MEGRDESEKVAATSMAVGTDVNFGELDYVQSFK
jgi:malate dehydrogenase (quinone)